MGFRKADDASRAYFASVVPDDSRVEVKKMFGNVAAFVNGNMFLGLLGTDVMLRLSPEDRDTLLAEPGASIPEPMKGRPMREYAAVPPAWRDDPDRVREWAARSLAWTEAMPPKKPKKAKKRSSKKSAG